MGRLNKLTDCESVENECFAGFRPVLGASCVPDSVENQPRWKCRDFGLGRIGEGGHSDLWGLLDSKNWMPK
jgi:hypothetical protein